MAETPVRAVRKEREGVVVSDAMDKSIVVLIERRMRHPKYGKEIKRFKKFYVHDEKNEAKKGDRVLIVETRPLSKLKRWRLVRVVAHGAASTKAEG
jgi:small subunit ribosomal protein S17